MEGALLTVIGEANIPTKPDMATINVGVTMQAPNAADALSANNRKMNQVFAALKTAGVADKDIQTNAIQVSPQYVYADKEPPRITGYEARNSVSVRVKALEKLGPTIDSVVRQGGNQIDSIEFGLDEPAPKLDEARSQAMKNALKRAELYAAAAGLKVHRIVSITEQSAVSPPPVFLAAAKRVQSESFDATPVSGGELTLSANVTVSFELR